MRMAVRRTHPDASARMEARLIMASRVETDAYLKGQLHKIDHAKLRVTFDEFVQVRIGDIFGCTIGNEIIGFSTLERSRWGVNREDRWRSYLFLGHGHRKCQVKIADVLRTVLLRIVCRASQILVHGRVEEGQVVPAYAPIEHIFDHMPAQWQRKQFVLQ